jgi:hypothetical protein
MDRAAILRAVGDLCTMVRSLSVVIFVAGVWLGGIQAGAQTASLPICGLLDYLSSFRNKAVEVSGEVVGSFRHGFFLAPAGRAETCPGWPEHGFTRHALIALTFRPDRFGTRLIVPPEFLRLDEMVRTQRLYPRVVTTLLGRVEANWLVLTYRSGTDKWLGLIGGEPYPDGSVPARLEVERVTSWVATFPHFVSHFPIEYP